MNVCFSPSIPASSINAPPSKSCLHRFLICSMLSTGESIIKNVGFSDDILATLDCIKTIGAETKTAGNTIYIKGISGRNISVKDVLDCRECGSTLRFLLPVCMLFDGITVLTGSGKLLSRPMGVYEDICRENDIYYLNDGKTVSVSGGLRSGKYTVPGDISSQFISGLLFALPLCDDDSIIEITGKTESKPYIDMTLDSLSIGGVSADWISENAIFVKGRQTYRPLNVIAEGDWSNAAFFLAFNAFGYDIKVAGLNDGSKQGDKKCVEFFEQLKKSNAEIDISDCPDLGPVLFVTAAGLNGARFIGTKRLRYKESDRVGEMLEELSKFGIRTMESEDSVTVFPSEIHTPTEHLNGHNDHRIVMALSVLAAIYGGIIKQADAVNKSYPNFFDDLKKIGVELTYEA